MQQQSPSDAASLVELTFSFVQASSDAPVVLPRTYITFFDFDTSGNGARECLQVNGGVAEQTLATGTQLEIIYVNSTSVDPTFLAVLSALPAGADLWDSSDSGVSSLLCSTQTGTKNDNVRACSNLRLMESRSFRAVSQTRHTFAPETDQEEIAKNMAVE